MVGLAMAWAAVGLVLRESWGAYLLAGAAFVSVLPIGYLLLLMAGTWHTQPDTTPDPLGRILWGAVVLAVTVGGAVCTNGQRRLPLATSFADCARPRRGAYRPPALRTRHGSPSHYRPMYR